MFRRKEDITPQQPAPAAAPADRITSVLGEAINLGGKLTGKGGVRVEGAFDGEIQLDGLLVIGTTGRVTC